MKRKFLKNYFLWLALFLLSILSSFQQRNTAAVNDVHVKIIFVNNIRESKLILNDSTYTNPFDEKYTITKLRYYVTNVSLQNGDGNVKEKKSYHLIDESKISSQVINFSVPAGDYNSIQFLLGVDSLHNVSGAQTDDLDPTKDMFWTWNSGYVMAKMEGHSPDSKMVNNKYEFHVGGFSGPYNVLKEIHLNFPRKAIHFEAGKKYEIFISADINTWWQSPHNIKIAEHPTITTPGENAKNISDNYANMFHLEKVIPE
ncbi:MAG: MbnP family protein [Ginsengibacter sp.]